MQASANSHGDFERPVAARPISLRAGFLSPSSDSAARADSKETAASRQADAALREAELGNTALTLARIGDAHRAKALVEELEKKYPSDTTLKLCSLPTISAAIELNKRNSYQEFGSRRSLRVGNIEEQCFRTRSISRLCVCGSVSSRAPGQRSRSRVSENPRRSRNCNQRTHRRHSSICKSVEPTRFKAALPRPAPRIRTSGTCGKTPTPTVPS